jgi:hypothetical protein
LIDKDFASLSVRIMKKDENLTMNRRLNMMNVIANVIAKNPPSILIVLGVFLSLLQNSLGVPLITAGIGLNVLWLVLRFR